MNLETSIVLPNEVVKAEDWTYGLDKQVDNIGLALAAVLETKNSFVIGGKVKPYIMGGLNLSIDPIFGINANNLQCFTETSVLEPIPITPVLEGSRIDIVEIKGEYEEFDEQQRKFLDFETDVETIQTINTKKRLKTIINIKMGEINSAEAPVLTPGWVKLAEIFVSSDTDDISQENIHNITADVVGMENKNWTNDKFSTYNLGYISELTQKFRTIHNSDGSLKERSVGATCLDIGTQTNQINGNILPLGKEISLEEDINITTPVTTVINIIAEKITDLYEYYMKKGAFQFKGEIAASIQEDDNNSLVKPIRIIADGEGKAQILIGDKLIMTMSEDGAVKLGENYTPVDRLDIVTKAVTDAISVEITTLKKQIEEFQKTSDFTVYSNDILSRFEISSVFVRVATTENIDLVGLRTIDGISVVAGNVVLVKNQNNKRENGLYVVAETSWQRFDQTDPSNQDKNFTTEDSLKHKLFVITSGNLFKGHLFYTPLEFFTIGETELIFNDSIFSIIARSHSVVMRNKDGKIEGNITGYSANSYVSDTSKVSYSNTDLTCYIPFVDSSRGGNFGLKSSEKLMYNPYTGTLKANVVKGRIDIPTSKPSTIAAGTIWLG